MERLLILVLAIGMWIMTDILIIKPIEKVAAGLKDIAQGEGDLTFRLQVNTDDEVGELSKHAKRLNDMVGKFKLE